MTGNLTTEYRRRISKIVDGKPVVADNGTNHIDDSWTENTIYKGEIAVDLDSGKIYTSDGTTSVELNKKNTTVGGLQLMPVTGATTYSNPLWIEITSGTAVLNGKTYWHTSVKDKDSSITTGDFVFEPNTANNSKYWLVYAKPYETTNKNYEYDDETQTSNLDFFAFSVDSEDELYLDDYSSYTTEDLDSSIFLGVVWMPAKYNSKSKNKLRPWSVSVSQEGLEYSLIDAITSDKEEVTPSALMKEIKSGLASYTPGNTPRECLCLVKGQVFLYGASLCLVLETHYCDDIDTSIEEGKIVKLGEGGGSVGSSIHSDLSGLAYGLTGHEGTFQRKTTVSTSSPTSYSNISNGDFWITLEENGSVNAGYVYADGKWVEFITTVRDSLNNKDLTIDDMESVVFTNKQANTYIGLSVNGIMCRYGEDYTFMLDGEEVEMEDVDNTSSYSVNLTTEYEIEDDDVISFYYLESEPLVIDMTDWNVLDGGSSTKAIW